MRESHYLGSIGLIGESLRYVAEIDERWVALVGWCGAAFKCSVRDRWIGWPEVIQFQRLRFISNNARFLVLPGVQMPNLASRVLGLNVRRLSADWERTYGHSVVIAETFVDPRRFRGTCYRAAGWIALGETKGFARSAGKWVAHGEPKLVFVRPLVKGAVSRLSDPSPMAEAHPKVMAMKLDGRRTEQLIRVLMRLPDARDAHGIRHQSTCILAIAVCAVLGGARSYEAIAEWAGRLNQNHRRRLDCRMNRSTGKRDVPSESAIRRYLQSIDVEAVDAALGQWLMSLCRNESPAVAIDGKTLRGSGREGNKVHLLSAVVHGTGVTVAQRKVGEKSNEIPAAPVLLEKMDLRGKVVTGDAMHTQKEFARFLVEDKKADYVLTVKENQPTLKKDIEEMFEIGSIPPSA